MYHICKFRYLLEMSGYENDGLYCAVWHSIHSSCGVNEYYRCVYKRSSNKQCEYTATCQPLRRFVMNPFASLEGEDNISSVFFFTYATIWKSGQRQIPVPHIQIGEKNFWQLMLPSRDLKVKCRPGNAKSCNLLTLLFKSRTQSVLVPNFGFLVLNSEP